MLVVKAEIQALTYYFIYEGFAIDALPSNVLAKQIKKTGWLLRYNVVNIIHNHPSTPEISSLGRYTHEKKHVSD